MRIVFNRRIIAAFISFGLVGFTGCKEEQPVPPQPADTQPANAVKAADTSSSGEAEAATGEKKPKERYDKIQKDDMYLERARKSIKPENLESEIRRLELEVRKFEEKLEQQENVLKMAEDSEKKSGKGN